MPTLLRIDVSARGSESISRTVTDSFEASWLDQLPAGEVVARDLITAPVPHYPAELIPRTMGHEVDSPAAHFQDELVDELLMADAVVVSTPMYNLAIPSVLKAWIDHIVLLGRTLRPHEDAPTAGVPVTIITAFGGGYGPGTPREGWDHVKPYLDAVFSGILGMDVEFVSVELTLAATTPGMEGLGELAEHSLARGHADATDRAAQVAASITETAPPILKAA